MHKVLHFSNKPAFPLRDGGCIAISSILRSLLASDGIEVVHLTLSTFKHSFKLESYPLSWREKMTVENVAIETKTNIFDAFRYLLMNKSYNVVRFYDKDVEKKLIELIQKHQFDSVVMESIYLLPYLQIFKKYGIKIILRTHNVEHKIWSSLAENSTSLLKKWYLNKLSLQLEKYELENCKEVDGIISITEDDAQFFQQFEPKTHTTCIPPMVVINEENTNYDLSDFYFLGAMDWQPNIEGINWFIKDVIPNGLIGTEFYLGGKNLNKKDYQHEGITNVGEKNDIVNELIRQCIGVIACSLYMLILSSMVVAVGSVMRFVYKKSADITFLGIGTLLLSISMTAESNIRQFFLPNGSIASHVGFLITILIPYPFMVYVSRLQKRRYEQIYKLLACGVILNFVVSLMLQLMGIVDLLDSTAVSYAIIILMLFFFAVTICIDIKKKRIREYGEVIFGIIVMILVSVWETMITFIPSIPVDGGIALSFGLIVLLATAVIKTA